MDSMFMLLILHWLPKVLISKLNGLFKRGHKIFSFNKLFMSVIVIMFWLTVKVVWKCVVIFFVFCLQIFPLECLWLKTTAWQRLPKMCRWPMIILLFPNAMKHLILDFITDMKYSANCVVIAHQEYILSHMHRPSRTKEAMY